MQTNVPLKDVNRAGGTVTAVSNVSTGWVGRSKLGERLVPDQGTERARGQKTPRRQHAGYFDDRAKRGSDDVSTALTRAAGARARCGRAAVVCFALIAAAGCADKASSAHEAEKRLELVNKHGTLGEECAVAREVSDAWLKAGDEHEYEMAHMHADTVCLTADLEGSSMPADDALRTKIQREAADVELNAASAAADAAGNAVDAASDRITANETANADDSAIDNE